MSDIIKSEKEILAKLGIKALNDMQVDAREAIGKGPEVLLLSPTGTGKTLAFLLPVISDLKMDLPEVQALIIAPSRELAMQIESVAREMGTGLKVNVVYGGRPIAKDKDELKTAPAVLVGTPGRIADHFRRGTFSLDAIKYLVLDEFDKSLEIGFKEQMQEILDQLSHVKNKVLTSATQGIEIPGFMPWSKPKIVDYSSTGNRTLTIQQITSSSKDKLAALGDALERIGNQPGIVFCNFIESIERLSEYLSDRGIAHGCFYGKMEQTDRERALIKFRNGTHRLLLATDLAARGIDVPEIKFIIHYHLPLKKEEFTHRNGRTARMNAKGVAYVLHWEQEVLPDFIGNIDEATFDHENTKSPTTWSTLFISGGRRDKISKGDIAGLFFKQGQLKRDELGVIELKQDCAFVSVPQAKKKQLIRALDNQRIKKRKVRIREV
ncbi:MAG: DEAD/DEAH box helicase [Bacteroidia bacterium]